MIENRRTPPDGTRRLWLGMVVLLVSAAGGGALQVLFRDVPPLATLATDTDASSRPAPGEGADALPHPLGAQDALVEPRGEASTAPPPSGVVLRGSGHAGTVEEGIIELCRVSRAPDAGHVRVVEAVDSAGIHGTAEGTTSSRRLAIFHFWWEDALIRTEGTEQTRVRAGGSEVSVGPNGMVFVVRPEADRGRAMFEEPYAWLRWVSGILPRLKKEPAEGWWSGAYPRDAPWDGKGRGHVSLPGSTIRVFVSAGLGLPTRMEVRPPPALEGASTYLVDWHVDDGGRLLPRRSVLENERIAGLSSTTTRFFDWRFDIVLDWDVLAKIEVRSPVVIDARRGGSQQDRYEVVLVGDEECMLFDARDPEEGLEELVARVDQPWIDEVYTPMSQAQDPLVRAEGGPGVRPPTRMDEAQPSVERPREAIPNGAETPVPTPTSQDAPDSERSLPGRSWGLLVSGVALLALGAWFVVRSRRRP